MATRHEKSKTWNDDDVCPKIAKKVKDISKATTSCKAYPSSPGEYEIHEGKSQFPLSLNNKICSCGAWQLSGIPCRHAIRAMFHAKVDPYNYTISWYSVKTYKQLYNHCINPVPDMSQWPSMDAFPHIDPPKMKRGIGRPRRNRRREEGEEQPGKRSRTVKCGNCGSFGHNSRTCKGGPTNKEAAQQIATLLDASQLQSQPPLSQSQPQP
ncbi:uncharacterized protein LOC110689495 [Chenopodium quinoa]|uniref:uncharacterized protein LOC110689495 n=1 Tax=Chenopodium quinoa TaxID=63459 RepID=UPI000B78DAB8|nr:uncharacterized protein LOC110689495 [Chenopodium quinoa]